MLRVALDEALSPHHLPPGLSGQPRRRGQVTVPETQYALATLVRLLAPADVLEIGTFFADTARVIASTMAEIGAGHLTTIDPFGGDRVPDIIASWPEELRQRVNFRPDNSMTFFLYLDEEAHAKRGKDAPFKVIFVDGHHSFDYAFFDLMRSTLFLKPGGALVVDNIEQPGPATAVRVFLERHTRWQLFKYGGSETDSQFLGFHPTANAAIILAPDGIEIGPLPYRIDMYDLPVSKISQLPIKLCQSAPGVLRVMVNFYSRPADYAATGTGELVCVGVAERKISGDERDFVSVSYDPTLSLAPQQGDRVAAQIELSFTPDGGENLLVDADPLKFG